MPPPIGANAPRPVLQACCCAHAALSLLRPKPVGTWAKQGEREGVGRGRERASLGGL